MTDYSIECMNWMLNSGTASGLRLFNEIAVECKLECLESADSLMPSIF